MDEMQQKGVYRPYALSQQGHDNVWDWEAENAGILVQGEHNGSRFDRTAWYAFTEYGKKVMEESEDEEHGR